MLWAQEERRKIRERTVRGQRARGHQGYWPGGTPPYGWRLEGHKPARPVRDEAEHETFMLMVDLLVRKRWNCGKIADHLNALDVPTRSTIRDRKRAERLGEPEPAATPWSREVIRMILGNDVHWNGKVVFGAPNQSGKYARSHKTKLDWQGKPVYGDPIELTLPEPPLTKAEYQAVRRALARREQSNPAAARSQMLTMRLFGECGKPYYGVSLKDKPFDTYRCTGNRHGRAEKCGCKQVQVQDLDERVWSVVADFLSDPARLEAAARAWLDLPDEADENGAEAIAGIDKRIRELERGQANAARELLLSDTPDLLRAALADIGRELATLKERRAAYDAFRAQATAKAQQISDLAALAERARGRLATMPQEARREVCEILGIRVQMEGGIVSGKDRVARPARLVVTGSIDPRLSFGEDGGAADGGSGGGPGPDNSGSDGRTPGGSSGAHLVARRTPSNFAKSDDELDHLHLRVRLLNTDLQTVQVLGGADRLLGVVHVAHAGVDASEHGETLRVLEGGVQLGEVVTARQHGGLGLDRLEDVGQVEDREVGVERLEGRAAGPHHGDRAGGHVLQHILLGAELLVRVDLDVVAAVGGLGQQLAELDAGGVLRVLIGLVEGELQGGGCATAGRLTGASRGAAATGDERQGQQTGGDNRNCA